MNRPIVQHKTGQQQPVPQRLAAQQPAPRVIAQQAISHAPAPQPVQQQQQQPPPAQQPSGLSAAAQKMLADVDLLPGEVVHYSIQGDGFFLGANPLVKIAAALQSALITLTGGHIRVFVFVTNRRILMLQSQAAFFGFRRIRSVQTIALAALAEAGSARDTQWCCIHTRTVTLVSKTQRYTLVIKHLNDRALREFVWNLSAVLVANTANRTA